MSYSELRKFAQKSGKKGMAPSDVAALQKLLNVDSDLEKYRKNFISTCNRRSSESEIRRASVCYTAMKYGCPDCRSRIMRDFPTS